MKAQRQPASSSGSPVSFRSARMAVGFLVAILINNFILLRYVYVVERFEKPEESEARPNLERFSVSAPPALDKDSTSHQNIPCAKQESQSPPQLSHQKPSERTKQRFKTKVQEECDAFTGLQLLDDFERRKATWCSGGTSSLVCYSHNFAQAQRGRPYPDTFCEATNFFIDFSKVHKRDVRDRGAYLQFDPGATFADCIKTGDFRQELLMNHQRLQLGHGNFQDGKAPPNQNFVDVAEPHYLWARDEDGLNPYHGTSDFIVAFITGEVLNLDWQATQVVMWDAMPPSIFEHQIKQAFSPKTAKLKRAEDFGGGVYRFQRLIFHLESPASLFYNSFNRGVTHCGQSELWMAFRKHMVNAYGLAELQPPNHPVITIVTRDPRNNRRVPRRFKDLDAVLQVAKGLAPFGHQVQIIKPDKTPIEEQMRIFRQTTILVGIHGAGLVNTLYLADKAVLLEIHPGERVDYYFRTIAMMSGVVYLPMRTATTCNAAITEETDVDLEEFRYTIDAALRVARQFNGGSAECGLDCLKNFAALTDPHFDTEYGKVVESSGKRTLSKSEYASQWMRMDSARHRCNV